MGTASSQSGGLVLSEPAMLEFAARAEAARCGLTVEEFAQALQAVGRRLNHGLPAGATADDAQCAAFYNALRLPELALAHGCALGRELAWERFLEQFRAPVLQAAIAITRSATLGHDLADSLYAELFGMAVRDGARRSPLASYSGRGSLLGWLRTTLAQRNVDHHRRTHREEPLETAEPVAPAAAAEPPAAELTRLSTAVARTLEPLAAEDRFLLSAYFLDRQTLLTISRMLRVHEATVSRRIGRLTTALRDSLLRNLQAGGLSRRGAEEALGTDPRDLEINLRALLQSSQLPPFLERTVPASEAGKA